MSIPIQPKLASGKRFGLAHDAIFRLWKSALKDDDTLIDEAIAGTYDRMISIDPVRAEKAQRADRVPRASKIACLLLRPTMGRSGQARPSGPEE